MNNASQVIVTLVHYNVSVRDTLEYCLPRETYDQKAYAEKKRVLLGEIEQNTPLHQILEQNAENGPKLEKQIRDFYEEVYGDNSTIIRDASDGLRVDAAQHLAIYRNVLPIHESVNNMILGIVNDAKNKKIALDENVAKLVGADEAMYRGVAYMALVNDLIRLFGEYNQARNEAKGEETPASRFIGNDIRDVIQNINFVRGNAKITNAIYKNMEDKINDLIENITGRRDLPVGKRFPDVFRETQETIGLYVRDAEAAFRAIYQPTITAFLEDIKKAQPAPEANAA